MPYQCLIGALYILLMCRSTSSARVMTTHATVLPGQVRRAFINTWSTCYRTLKSHNYWQPVYYSCTCKNTVAALLVAAIEYHKFFKAQCRSFSLSIMLLQILFLVLIAISWLTDWLIDQLIDSWLVYRWNDWLNDWLTDWIVCLVKIRSFLNNYP